MNNQSNTPTPTVPPQQPATPAAPSAKTTNPDAAKTPQKPKVSVPKITLPKINLSKLPKLPVNIPVAHFLFTFLKFWFWDSPVALYHYFVSLNLAFLELFSLPLFLQTFFKPLKNEYREGLVGFSKFMGMTIKSLLIVVDVILFTILLTAEAVIFVSYLFFPFATAFLLFL